MLTVLNLSICYSLIDSIDYMQLLYHTDLLRATLSHEFLKSCVHMYFTLLDEM